MIKKWILLIVILFAIEAATIISITYRAPTSKTLQTVKSTEEVEDGTVITTSYTNSSGSVVIAADKGYAAKRVTKDQEGHTVLEEFLDGNNELIALSAGYAAISYSYTDGLATGITYLDEEMKPVVISSGYNCIHRTYTDQKLDDIDTYWIDDTPVIRKEGYAFYSRVYDDKKQIIMLEYRGLDGELINTISGYARRIRSFNDAGKVSEERYYDASGSPAVLSLGQSGYTRRYDSHGRTIETTYLDPQGQPINTTRGYATVKKSYTENGIVTQYFDVGGNPVTGENSNYGVLDTGEQKIYLNEDGEIVHRLDNVLMRHPMWVLMIGTIITIVSLFLKEKIRWIFLVAYFLFVLYMTMYYREPTGFRNRQEFFYSYRRMLTNDTLRQQIINNIFLFIPLGTILSNLLSTEHAHTFTFNVSVGLCMLISIGIEMIQWNFGIGLAEADDVISNTLGGAIGAAIAALVRPTKDISQAKREKKGKKDQHKNE